MDEVRDDYLSLDFPYYLLAKRGTIEMSEEPGKGAVMSADTIFKGVDTEMGKALVLFTDIDLAERFVIRVNDANAVGVSINDEASLVQALQLAQMQGFTMLAADISGVPGARIKWQESIIEKLKALLR